MVLAFWYKVKVHMDEF